MKTAYLFLSLLGYGALVGCSHHVARQTMKTPPSASWKGTAEVRLNGPGFALAADRKTLAFTCGQYLYVTYLDSPETRTESYSFGTPLSEVAFAPNCAYLAAVELVGSDPAKVFVVRYSSGSALNVPDWLLEVGLIGIGSLEDSGCRLRFSDDSKYLACCLGGFNAPGEPVVWRLPSESPNMEKVPMSVVTKNEPAIDVGHRIDVAGDSRTFVIDGRRLEAPDVDALSSPVPMGHGLLTRDLFGALALNGLTVWSVRTGRIEMRIFAKGDECSIRLRTASKHPDSPYAVWVQDKPVHSIREQLGALFGFK